MYASISSISLGMEDVVASGELSTDPRFVARCGWLQDTSWTARLCHGREWGMVNRGNRWSGDRDARDPYPCV